MKKQLFSILFLLMSCHFVCAQDNVYNADSSRVHNDEALAYIRQLLDNPIDSAQFEACNAYIMKWASASHDIDVNIDENIGEFMEAPGGRYYILGYIAACCEAELLDGIPSMNWKRFISAMKRLVDFYRLNRNFTGKVNRLENYAAIDDPIDFEKTLRIDFSELIKNE